MKQLILGIQDNIKRRNYLSALSLALTLPDICGKIAFPEKKNGRPDVGGRYAKWYDEYIYPYENPPDLLECDSSDSVPLNPLNGYAVYKLRCSLLHEGSIDIQDTVEKNPHKSQQVYRKLEFHLTDKLTSSGSFWEPGKKNEQLITIRIGTSSSSFL